MSFIEDDLAALLAPNRRPERQAERAPVQIGQGVIRAYDNQTGENSVEYRGATLANLPTLSGPETLTLAQGDVVALVVWSGQIFILGKISRPPFTNDAADFLRNQLAREIAAEVFAARMTTAEVPGQGRRASTAFGDCDDQVGPVVSNIEVTAGSMLVECGARVIFGGPSLKGGGLMSFDVDGPTPSSAGGSRFVEATIDGINTAAFNIGRMFRVAGLAPGSYTVTAKYRVSYAGESADFDQRLVTVTAL